LANKERKDTYFYFLTFIFSLINSTKKFPLFGLKPKGKKRLAPEFIIVIIISKKMMTWGLGKYYLSEK